LQEVGDIISKGSSLSGHDEKGRFLWSVGADTIRVRDERTDDKGKVTEPRRATLTGGRATLYREGKPTSLFRAARIELVHLPQGVMMTMTGGVTASTPLSPSANKAGRRGPITLQTPEVKVDVKQRRLRADKGVQMTQDNTRVNAKTLSADTALHDARLGGGIKAVAPEGTLTADNAVWNWDTRRALVTGKIVVSHEGTTITGTRLDADTNAERGTLSGDVRAVSSEGQARAARLHFDWRRRVIEARGGVTLAKEGATLRASRVNTDDKLRQATADGGVTLVKDDVILRAARVDAFDRMTRAVATGDVTLIRGPAAERATMRAARAEVWIPSQRAVASGGVTLARGDLNMRAGRVEAVNLQDRNAMRIVATGDVYARNSDGSVRAERVTWGGGRVIGSGNVMLQKGANTLGGARLETDDKFTSAQLSGSVSGRLSNASMVSAGSLSWQNGPGGGRVLARDGVSARRGNLRLRANRMDATGDGSHATLTGNVVVTSDQGVTVRAPVVRYDKAAAKVFASGGVTFRDPQRGLQQHGKTLVADLKLKQATLTDVTGSGDMRLFKDKKLF
jgi:lipopolysaccharide assembly outer membrane protein LptD (OstA)